MGRLFEGGAYSNVREVGLVVPENSRHSPRNYKLPGFCKRNVTIELLNMIRLNLKILFFMKITDYQCCLRTGISWLFAILNEEPH